MSGLRTVWQCVFSPRLNKIYGEGSIERRYEPGGFEKWGDQVITSLYLMWNFGVYTSPLIAGFMYRKGYFVAESIMTLTKFVTSIGVILVMSFCIRGFGRSNTPSYRKFLKTLQTAQNKSGIAIDIKRELCKYDFEFSSWPVEFYWSDIEEHKSIHRTYVSMPKPRQNAIQWVVGLPCNIFAYIAVHTFGIRLIYPGVLGIIQTIIGESLLQGRARLVEEHNGERFKLRSRDNNDIDTMFIDRRNVTRNGSILVVCSEGNAGFYEIGIMCTPIEAGYSVLGWNHPGFGGSTGIPYPDQEQNAIDVVMQFAIHRLGFTPENIILFGWSIGGYSTSWAAMNYPDIKGVILDASFDDVLPLAVEQMPGCLEPIVRSAIRHHANLNNSEQLCRYPGPVLLVRRTEDEVICTTRQDLATNRGNHLLVKLLKYRYPHLFEDKQMKIVNEFLSLTGVEQSQLLSRYGTADDFCNSLLESYISENSKSFPMMIGEEMQIDIKNNLALFLVRKHLKDFKSTHCMPLPVEYFQIPWDISVDSEYVFT